jgi:hypothetical protein
MKTTSTSNTPNEPSASSTLLPTEAAAREEYPVVTGCLDYFPAAILAVANLSWKATQQHHPGSPMHWDRSKSTGHSDKIVRHLLEAGDCDIDGIRHSAKVAWRALALLQEELEAAGAPLAPAAIPFKDRV